MESIKIMTINGMGDLNQFELFINENYPYLYFDNKPVSISIIEGAACINIDGVEYELFCPGMPAIDQVNFYARVVSMILNKRKRDKQRAENKKLARKYIKRISLIDTEK